MRQLQLAFAAILGGAALLAQAAAPAGADPAYYYPPKFHQQVKPIYPDSARAARETGEVKVKVLVGANGVPKSFTIFKSSGHKDLDDAVLAACKASTYSPATRGNSPVTAFYDVSYKFDLTGVEENVGSTSDLEAAVAAHPTDSEARLQLASLFLNESDYAHAESTLVAGTQATPSNAKIWSRLGLAYFNDGVAAKPADVSKLKLAADAYDKALAIDPNTDRSLAAQAYFRYAFELQNVQNSSAAQPYALKASQLDSKQFVYRMLLGETEISQNQVKQGLDDFMIAKSGDDGKQPTVSARLLAEIGNAELTLGQETAGLESINQAEAMAPHSPFAYQALQSYYMSKNNYTAALVPLKQLIQIQPTEPAWQVDLGDVYLNMKDWADANKAYETAAAMPASASSGDAKLGLAKLAAAQGQTTQIDAGLNDAIKASPSNASVYNTIVANILLNASSGKNDYSPDAMKYAKAGTDADPNNGNAWVSYGIALADQHKKDEASDALRKAYTIFKAKNDTADMTVVMNYYKQITGTDLPGADHNGSSNQAGGPG
jgi:TonB family protein